MFRALVAWEEGIDVDTKREHLERANLAEYKAKLLYGSIVLPDPTSLKEGWLDELSCTQWPSLYFVDIADYLRMQIPTELYHRLCNQYKQGKAYRLFFVT